MTWHIREAVRHVSAGGIIAYPTETVYGLGCDPFDAGSVLRLLELKQRSFDQGLILIASDFSQLEPLLQAVSTATGKRVRKTYPEPITWILPCLPDVPVWLRGKHHSLAVRITSHPIARALCIHWNGPLVSTSANLHGRHPATSPLAIHKAFHGKLDYILHGSTPSTKRPSEIRDGITGVVLRATGA